MSDDQLDIRGGGAVAVDTETLRAAATRYAVVASDLEEIARAVGSAALRAFEVARTALHATYAVETARRRILSAADAATGIAASLHDAAAVYEIVELRAERAAAAAGDTAALARIDVRLDVLSRDHPDAARRATTDVAQHQLLWPSGLSLQAPGAVWWLAPGMHSLAVPMAWTIQRALAAGGAGTVPRSARLTGPTTGVVVTALPSATSSTPPASLADAAARVPGDGAARIRVERYTMPDGSRQFAVYVAGTRTVAKGSGDPFDMTSNVELYTGERSASYDATVAALRQAGAEPGDVVHAFGHSQGAMIASRLALEGGFDTRTLVTFGSPVEADVGPGTLSVGVRHSDDPVAALATGGHAGGVGAPGSFIAERTADPLPGVHDLRMPAHGIDEYTRTAALLDGSTDARMGAVRAVFAELGGAASVEVTEYAAMRADEPALAPGPDPLSRLSAAAAG